MRTLKSILILILIYTCVVCVANAQDDSMRLAGTEPYDIGIDKTIDVHNIFKIKYRNDTVLNVKEVVLSGSIKVARRFRVEELQIDYYLFDEDHKVTRATNLKLVEVAPGEYTFQYRYPFNLEAYCYELFSIVFIIEEIETNNI